MLFIPESSNRLGHWVLTSAIAVQISSLEFLIKIKFNIIYKSCILYLSRRSEVWYRTSFGYSKSQVRILPSRFIEA